MSARPQKGADSRRSAAGTTSCVRCGTPVLKQLVGRQAALNVIADAEPIQLAEALRMAEPNRLAWCLATLHGGGTELRWLCAGECSHATVIEHRCAPEAAAYGRRPEGAMW